MGAWGTALFSDDTACNVRDDYRDQIGEGLSGPEATDRLLNEWRETLRDPDDGPVFWLALAATQWRCGRLESRVKEEVVGSSSLLPSLDAADLHIDYCCKKEDEEERNAESLPAEAPLRERVVSGLVALVGDLESGRDGLFYFIGRERVNQNTRLCEPVLGAG